jgi:hypothetical protein
MTIFANWADLPPDVRSHFDAIEEFVSHLDGKTACLPTDGGESFIDDGTIDAEDVIVIVNKLANAYRELLRTRSEAEAVATVKGFHDGEQAVIAQLRAQKVVVEIRG